MAVRGNWHKAMGLSMAGLKLFFDGISVPRAKYLEAKKAAAIKTYKR